MALSAPALGHFRYGGAAVLVHLVSVGFSPNLTLVVHVLAALILTPILSSAMNYERSTTELLVDKSVDKVLAEVGQLSEDLEDAKADYRQQVKDLEGVMRTALQN